MSRTVSKQSKNPGRKTSNELYHEEAKEFLTKNEIEIGSKTIEKFERGSPITNKEPLLIRTNIYTVIVKEDKPIYKYNVKITGLLRDLEPIEFTKCSASELVSVDRMDICSKVFDALFKLERGVFDCREKFYYDLCAVLYSVEEIGEDYTKKFTVEDLFADQENVDCLAKIYGRETFKIEITLEQGMDNADFAERMVRMNIDQHDMEAVRISEVITWQNAIKSPAEHVIFPKGRSYLSNPIAHGYHENDLIEYGNGIYLGVGFSKSSKLIESEKDIPIAAIVIEPKVMLFHHAEELIKKFKQMIETNRINVFQIRDVVRGLYFISSHWIEELKKVQIFKIHDVGKPANVQTFDFNGEVVTIAAYFSEQLVPLRYPDLPVIVVLQGGNFSYYPMEHCVLVDNQRVSFMSEDLIARFIQNSATKPIILQKRIDISRKVLFLENSNFLINAGITVSQQPIKVEVPILAAPKMKYGNNVSATFDEIRLDWKENHFVAPSTLDHWCAFVAIKQNVHPQFTDNHFLEFLTIFQNECARRQINLGLPINDDEIVVLKSQNLYEDLHNALEFAGKHGYKFALIITDASDRKIHLDLKAYEQKYGVVTQNVTHKTVLATLGIGSNSPNTITLGNIVNKTNIKLGGLNYEVINGDQNLGETDLFLGFALNHLATGIGNFRETGVPSILGYAANDSANSIAFTGDFIYNRPLHQRFLPSIFEAACKVFERFLNNRKYEPERVIVYRGGFSDGEFDYVMEYEVPTLRKAIKKMFKNDPNLVFISVNKAHNVRFTPDKVLMPNGNQTNARIQNIPVGVVIDSKIVRPIPEFYLASHSAIQGTAKVPRYNVLCNEAGASLSELEKITHDLCFCHQIINSPVSIPSPLYCAAENAKRGRNLLNSDVNYDFIVRSRREFGLEGKIDHDSQEVRRGKKEHAAALTKEMSYNHLEIRKKRFNA